MDDTSKYFEVCDIIISCVFNVCFDCVVDALESNESTWR
jgi:hypothetical protein